MLELTNASKLPWDPCCTCAYIPDDGLVVNGLLREGSMQHLVVKLWCVLCVVSCGVGLLVASSLPHLVGEDFNVLSGCCEEREWYFAGLVDGEVSGDVCSHIMKVTE